MWWDYFNMVYENITVTQIRHPSLKFFAVIGCVINSVLSTPLSVIKSMYNTWPDLHLNFEYLFCSYLQKWS